MKFLDELDEMGINYYFQFTVNDYETEGYEPNVPRLAGRIDTFKDLSEKIGPERVIWRFDPLLLTDLVGIPELLKKIEKVGHELHPYTRKLVFSFADINSYKKVQNNLNRSHITWHEFLELQMHEMTTGLVDLNRNWGLKLATCGEKIDLTQYGVMPNQCIDGDLMINQFKDDHRLMRFLGARENLFGQVSMKKPMKDKGQRKECGCIVSKDIGMYNTCRHLCVYCYANTSKAAVQKNAACHNPTAAGIIK